MQRPSAESFHRLEGRRVALKPRRLAFGAAVRVELVVRDQLMALNADTRAAAPAALGLFGDFAVVHDVRGIDIHEETAALCWASKEQGLVFILLAHEMVLKLLAEKPLALKKRHGCARDSPPCMYSRAISYAFIYTYSQTV